MSNSYVYIYLDPRKPGKFNYIGYNFEFEPFYVGKGTKSRIIRHLKEVDRNPLKVNKISKIKKDVRIIYLKIPKSKFASCFFYRN